MKKNLLQLVVFTAAILAANTFALSQSCSPDSAEGNCVVLARSEVPSLPTGLTTYQSKLNIINHHFPTVGSVAVMPVSGANAPYGHVSVVKSVAINANGTLTLTVDEGNWVHCVISYGTAITPESRNIQGYFDPNYPSGQASPNLTSLSGSTGTHGQQFYVTASGSGFDPATSQGIILGGWCDSFGKCAVPNNVIQNKSSTSLQIPVTLSSTGTYTLYIFNQASGKTSQGKQITIQ
jgi:surface antigen